MTVRFNRFQNPRRVSADAGLSSFMGWLHVQAIRWEWRLDVYFTV